MKYNDLLGSYADLENRLKAIKEKLLEMNSCF